MLFNYKAKDKGGVVKRGAVEAVSSSQASEILHGNGLVILSLEQQSMNFDLGKYIPFLNRVPRKELVMFSRQLSTLINAKVPILLALEILRDQVTSRQLQLTIDEMSDDIEGGKSFSEAISRFPRIFSNLYLNLVRAGELSGTMDNALLYLADQQERDYDLTSKVRGALTYPIFIVSAIFIIGALMFTFVLPQMIGVLLESGVTLPLTTRILIFITALIKGYWHVLLLGFIGLVVGTRLYVRSPAGRAVWDALKLKLPIVGKILKKIYMDRLALNLGTLIRGGIPIVQSLRTVAEIVGNNVYRQIILAAAAEVETGKPIASVFAEHPEVPVLVTQMIRIGEQTGSLAEILGKLANFYDKEVANVLATLTTLLEPVIMILLGAAVAVMVAGILLPIYNLASIQ